MKETAHVYVDDLKKAYANADAKGKATFVDLYPHIFGDITQRITTMEHVFAEAGVNPDDYKMPCNPTRRQRKRITAEIVELIYEVFQQDWIADWTDSNQPKWRAWWQFIPGSGFVLNGVDYGHSNTAVGARLVLPNEKLVRHVAKHFLPQINDYLQAQ